MARAREKEGEAAKRTEAPHEELLKEMFQDGVVDAVFTYVCSPDEKSGKGREKLEGEVKRFYSLLLDNVSEEEAEEKMRVYEANLSMLYDVFSEFLKVCKVDDPSRLIPPSSLSDLAEMDGKIAMAKQEQASETKEADEESAEESEPGHEDEEAEEAEEQSGPAMEEMVKTFERGLGIDIATVLPDFMNADENIRNLFIGNIRSVHAKLARTLDEENAFTPEYYKKELRRVNEKVQRQLERERQYEEQGEQHKEVLSLAGTISQGLRINTPSLFPNLLEAVKTLTEEQRAVLIPHLQEILGNNTTDREAQEQEARTFDKNIYTILGEHSHEQAAEEDAESAEEAEPGEAGERSETEESETADDTKTAENLSEYERIKQALADGEEELSRLTWARGEALEKMNQAEESRDAARKELLAKIQEHRSMEGRQDDLTEARNDLERSQEELTRTEESFYNRIAEAKKELNRVYAEAKKAGVKYGDRKVLKIPEQHPLARDIEEKEEALLDAGDEWRLKLERAQESLKNAKGGDAVAEARSHLSDVEQGAEDALENAQKAFDHAKARADEEGVRPGQTRIVEYHSETILKPEAALMEEKNKDLEDLEKHRDEDISRARDLVTTIQLKVAGIEKEMKQFDEAMDQEIHEARERVRRYEDDLSRQQSEMEEYQNRIEGVKKAVAESEAKKEAIESDENRSNAERVIAESSTIDDICEQILSHSISWPKNDGSGLHVSNAVVDRIRTAVKFHDYTHLPTAFGLQDKIRLLSEGDRIFAKMLDDDLAEAETNLESAALVEGVKKLNRFVNINIYDNSPAARQFIDARSKKKRGVLKFLARHVLSVRNVATALVGFGTGGLGNPAFVAWAAALGAAGGGVAGEGIVAKKEQKKAEKDLREFLEQQEGAESNLRDVALARNQYLAFARQQKGDYDTLVQSDAYARIDDIYQTLLRKNIDAALTQSQSGADQAVQSDAMRTLTDQMNQVRYDVDQGKETSKRNIGFWSGFLAGGAVGVVFREQIQGLFQTAGEYASAGYEKLSDVLGASEAVAADEVAPLAPDQETELSIGDPHVVEQGDRLFTILGYNEEQQAQFIQKWSGLSDGEKTAWLEKFGMETDPRNLGDSPDYLQVGDTVDKQAVREFLAVPQEQPIVDRSAESVPEPDEVSAAPVEGGDHETIPGSVEDADTPLSQEQEEGSEQYDDAQEDESVTFESTASEAFAGVLGELAGDESNTAHIDFQKEGSSLETVALADFKPWFNGEDGWTHRLTSLESAAEVVRNDDGVIEKVIIDLGEGDLSSGISFAAPDKGTIEHFIQSVSEQKRDIFDLKGDDAVSVNLVSAVESVLKIATLEHAGNAALMNEALPKLAESIVTDRKDPASIISALQKAEHIVISESGEYLNLTRQSKDLGEVVLGSVDIKGTALG